MDDRRGSNDHPTGVVLRQVDDVWAELLDIVDRIAARRNPPDNLVLDELVDWSERARPVIEDYRALFERMVAGSADDLAVLTGDRPW